MRRSNRSRVLSCALLLSSMVACGADGAAGPDQSARLPIAYSYNAEGVFLRKVYLTSADGRTNRLAFDLGGDQAIPQWAPDGRSLLLYRELGVSRAVVVNEDGSAMREVPGTANLIGGWSPDGAWIAISTDTTIDVMHADGSQRRTVVAGRPVDPLRAPCEDRPARLLLRENPVDRWHADNPGSGDEWWCVRRCDVAVSARRSRCASR